MSEIKKLGIDVSYCQRVIDWEKVKANGIRDIMEVIFGAESGKGALVTELTASQCMFQIVGTIIGTLIVGVLNNGLDLMLVDAYTQQILKGLIIIAAVIFDQMKNKR